MEKFSFLSFCPMAVARPSTNQSQRCSTSVISRELVCQRGYGVAPAMYEQPITKIHASDVGWEEGGGEGRGGEETQLGLS